MFESVLSTSLVIAGVLIIIILAAVPLLHWQLHLRKKRDAQLAAEHQAQAEQRRAQALNSLHIIAKSYLAEQVELAEAAIRISKLMDQLELSAAERTPFKVFDQIHAKLTHIPILKAWKALSKKEKRAHLATIAQVEQEHQAAAADAASQLANMATPDGNFLCSLNSMRLKFLTRLKLRF